MVAKLELMRTDGLRDGRVWLNMGDRTVRRKAQMSWQSKWEGRELPSEGTYPWL